MKSKYLLFIFITSLILIHVSCHKLGTLNRDNPEIHTTKGLPEANDFIFGWPYLFLFSISLIGSIYVFDIWYEKINNKRKKILILALIVIAIMSWSIFIMLPVYSRPPTGEWLKNVHLQQ